MYVSNMSYLNPQNDFAFKRVFGTKENKEVLSTMLNTMLKTLIKQPIEIIKYIPPIQNPLYLAKKESIVDVLCTDQIGNQYIIEMQVARQLGFKERAQYYASRAYIDQADEGVQYVNLKEVYSIFFTTFSLSNEEKKYYKNIHQVLNVKTHQRVFDKLSYVIVNLNAFKKEKKDVNILTIEEKFYHFLAYGGNISQKELEILSKEPTIKKAYRTVNTFFLTKEEKLLYQKELKRIKDNQAVDAYKLRETMKEGIKEGIKKGEIFEKKKIAKNMLNKGYEIHFIQEMTGLNPYEIEKIKKESDN